ncbi:MAG: amidohydrolase [Candidatus Limnocylindrales bacterium]
MTSPGVDVVFHGGHVRTVDDMRPAAEAVAVAGGRIVAIGDDADITSLAGSHTRVIDLRGRTLLPGFQDAHVHPVTSGLHRLQCDLTNGTTAEDYVRLVADYVARHPERPVVTGSGWSLTAFDGGTPSRALLDRVVADRPVILENRDGHGSWVNSVALRTAGVDASTPDPSDGRIEREPDGSPQGTLHEGAAVLVEQLIPEPTEDEWLEGARLGQAELHRFGITAWQEAQGTDGVLDAYRGLAERGELTGRVTVAQSWDTERGIDQIEVMVERRSSRAADRLRADRVKLFLDGIAENFTASMLEPYLGADGRPTNERGLKLFDADELQAVVQAVDAAGFHVHCHAIGDRAVRDGLDAIEHAMGANPAWDRRPTIAHIQFIHPDDLPRFRRLGVVANGQPLWAIHEAQMDRLTIPIVGPERASWQYPFGSLLRAGAPLAFGSDWSVSTADVLAEIEVAVRRVWPGHRDAKPFFPHECISLEAAVRAFTLGAAYVNGIDDVTGSISVGKLADLVVVDRDLFGPDVLPADARVLLTMIEGEAVFEDPALEG